MIMLLGNNSPSIYQFIIAFTHVISGWIVYLLMRVLMLDDGLSFCAGLLWSMSPFARVQTFHHWSYLMLPLYLLLFFLYITQRIHSKSFDGEIISKKNYLCSIVLMLSVIFSGEYTVAPLFISLFFLIVFYRNDKGLFKWFCTLFSVGIISLLSYIIVYQLFINRSDVHRFNIVNINIVEGLKCYGKSLIFAFKTFLFLPNEHSTLYPSRFNKNSVQYVSWKVIGTLFMLSVLVWMGGIYQLHKMDSSREIRKIPFLIIVAISFNGVYIIMDIAMGQGILPVRYFYSILTVFWVTLFIWLILKFPKSKYAVFSIGIVISSINLIVYYGILLPENKKVNTEIIENIEKAQNNGYENIVFLNAEGMHSPILIERESYKADSPFYCGWATYALIDKNYDFENIVFLKQGDLVQDLDNDKIVLHNSFPLDDRDIVLDGSKTFFCGLADLEYFNRTDRIPQRSYYYGYKELLNSQFYKGIEAAAMTETFESPFYHIMQNEAWTQEEVYWINCGETNKNERYEADIGYEISDHKEIYGSYQEEGSIGYTNIEEIDNKYYSTYRYGASFSYKFFNINEEDKYILAFDILEAYYDKERGRVFDIKVETTKNSFVIEDLDTIAIADGKVVPVRIMIHLPKCEWVKITFMKDEQCADVPYINGIGILKKLQGEK